MPNRRIDENYRLPAYTNDQKEEQAMLTRLTKFWRGLIGALRDEMAHEYKHRGTKDG